MPNQIAMPESKASPDNVAPTIPRVGMVVHYKLNQDDADRINMRRAHNHTRGNRVEKGDVFPMMIVKVWGDHSYSAVNGQVFLDGEDNFWVTSSCAGPNMRDFTFS